MRRSARAGTVLGIVWALVGLTSQPALALTVTPDQTYRTKNNDKVYALAALGNTIFVGGKVSRLYDQSGVLITTLNNIVAVDAVTGAWIPSFSASFTLASGAKAQIRALAVSPDGTTLYVGGKFDTVNGQLRKNFAALETATGALAPSFADLVVNQPVNAILVGDDRLYLGGDFKRVNGKPRSYLAAVALDGTLDTVWLPAASDTVRSLEWATDRATIFVGGKFQFMNAVQRWAVARVTPDTGALDPWAVPAGSPAGLENNLAWDLLATDTRLYGGFGNGPNFAQAFRLDLGPIGSSVWKFNTVGNVESLAFNADSSRLFVGGHFGTASLQQRVCNNSVNLRGLMLLDPATGAIDCSWVPQIVPFGSNFTGAWAMARTPTQLWVGGLFSSISGVTQAGFARFTL